jgi:hypothetical protein
VSGLDWIEYEGIEMSYRVLVDDNFHYMDETERYELGTFATLEAAIQAAKEVVDACLASEHQPGMTASQLYEQYQMFGDDPFILGPERGKITFSAWEYARECCEDLCGPEA